MRHEKLPFRTIGLVNSINFEIDAWIESGMSTVIECTFLRFHFQLPMLSAQNRRAKHRKSIAVRRWQISQNGVSG
jgi:hypothetical protein